MATKYNISITNYLTTIDGIEAALNAKGLITATLYKASGYLIFTTPLTDKVVKIRITSNMQDFFIYFGDAWVSGSTITNQIQFGVLDVTNPVTALDVIVDANYFIIVWQVNSYYAGVCYIGALDNGDVLVFSMNSSSAAAHNSMTQAVNITTGSNLYPISFNNTGFKDPAGNIFTMPLMWADSANNLQMNGNNPSGTLGVKVSSVTNISGANVGTGVGYFLMPSTMYMTSSLIIVRSSLLIEYTP